MIDEGELRRRFPGIPWDQPVEVEILREGFGVVGDEGNLLLTIPDSLVLWACRYCVALHGVTAQELLAGERTKAFATRSAALDHIEQEHHD